MTNDELRANMDRGMYPSHQQILQLLSDSDECARLRKCILTIAKRKYRDGTLQPCCCEGVVPFDKCVNQPQCQTMREALKGGKG